jgi:D-glycerate 3-kinase
VSSLEPKSDALDKLLERFVSEQVLPNTYASAAHKWFIPLVKRIAKHQRRASKTIVVGINGCQGSGKSTLTKLVSTLLNDYYNIPCIGFSIDDFYLSKQARQTLAKSINPLLATRGAPGTHDIALLETVLTNLTTGKAASIPVFDKSIDDLKPVNEWIKVDQTYKVVILEGWCVGLTSQAQTQLASPVNTLEAIDDINGEWRQYVNDVLSIDYARVFAKIDYLAMLKAPSFEQVYAWRCEQEHKLKAYLSSKEGASTNNTLGQSAQQTDSVPSKKSTGIMTDQEILRFIQFYQRLTQHALTSLPAKCDSIFILDEKRSIKECAYK